MLAAEDKMLQSYFLGDFGLGEFDPSSYRCAYSGAFYICAPRAPAGLEGVRRMQRAIDAFLTLLPLFRTTDTPIPSNPIGTSKSGYDGRVGPLTSGLGLVAIIGAADMIKAADEGDPPPAVVMAMRVDALDERGRTESFTRYAPEIADFLENITSRFKELLAKIAAKRAEGDRPIFVEPPPIPVPGVVKPLLKPKKSYAPLAVGLAIAGAALIGGTAMYLTRDQKPDGKKKHDISPNYGPQFRP